MKRAKGLIILFFVLIIGSAAYADVSLGITGKAGSGVGSVRSGDYDDIYGVTDDNLNMLAGFDIAAQFTFGEGTNRFFIRPEAGMMFNNGVGNGLRFTYEDHSIGITNDSDCVVSVSTIDIPVLFGMETSISSWMLDFYLGPYLSIPLGGTITTAGGASQLGFVSPVLGSTAGITGNLSAGPGAFIFDMRYLFDFASTRMTVGGSSAEVSIYARRNIELSAGYKINL